MDLDAVSEEDLGRTPCIASGCDPTGLRLSAAEGYLLSRIDGQTPWRLLREIGGLTPDEVDMCLEMWMADGVIEMGGYERRPKAPPKPRPEAPAARPGEIDEGAIDDSLDLDVETQRRILEMESRLGCGYAEILGVSADASEKQIKKSYRALSRDFHPDRYFRKQIGDYKPRLEAIFKKVLEAYELLSDPATRAEVQKAMAQQAPAASPGGAAPATPDPAKPLTPIERLRMRMPFKIPEAVLNERRSRARQFYDSARTWAENDHHLEAASSIRLAIAFDPHEELYKQYFSEIQAGISDARIEALLREAPGWSDAAAWGQGLKECEELLLYRPHDPELNCAAAVASAALGDGEAARELAERAVEHSPDVPRYRRVLAQALARLGDRGHAIRELEQALELDPGDAEARALLEKLKPRRAVHGGTK